LFDQELARWCTRLRMDGAHKSWNRN